MQVPPAQVPMWPVVISGSLRGDSWAGSPDVQAPGGQVGLEPPRSGQHRGQAIRRAVAKANGLNAEMGPRTKLIQAEYWRCQEFLLSIRWPVPMRKDGAVPVSDLPAEVEGGNPGEPSSKKLGRSGIQTGGSLNVKDRAYNRLCWEMDRRKPDWRMRSASDEGEAMKNSPERGPLGPGGIVRR